MQNRTSIKEYFKKPTDINYRNLFQPVIPHLDLTGKIAQIISALTEAITVWFICQSELSEVNKTLSILLSIIAVLLVVTAIELGGRKGIQVLTRAIVWKRLKSFWYWALFIPVLLITVFLFWQSFQLSTQGTNRTFQQSVQSTVMFDDSTFFARHLFLVAAINTKFDKKLTTTSNAYNANYVAKEMEFNSRIDAVDDLLKEHKRNKANSIKWAQSHINKQTKNRNDILTDKAAALAALTQINTIDVKTIENARTKELTAEKERYQTTTYEAKKIADDNHQHETDNANFWGSLFSNLVGIMIITAFVCIVIVEIFRKGSGIEVEYIENEAPPSLWSVFWQGVNNRTFNVSYKMVSKVYVEKKTFDFGFIQPTLSEYQQNTITLNRKHNLPLLFNTKIDDNIQFSANAKDGEIITTTVELNPIFREDPTIRAHVVLDDLSSDDKNNQNPTVKSGQIVGEKNCKNCGVIFQYKNKKKLYCSDNCRQVFWEKTNGRKLKKGRIKDK